MTHHIDGNFIRAVCAHCKLTNYWCLEQDNTIQTCPACKVNSYIKNSTNLVKESVDIVDAILDKANQST